MDSQNMTDVGKLGFGLMRLPRKGVKIDVDQVAQMVDLFLTPALRTSIPHAFTPGQKLPRARPL